MHQRQARVPQRTHHGRLRRQAPGRRRRMPQDVLDLIRHRSASAASPRTHQETLKFPAVYSGSSAAPASPAWLVRLASTL